MSRFSGEYLATRLSIFANRLITVPAILDLVELDLESILHSVGEVTRRNYEIDSVGAGRIEHQFIHAALNDFQILMRPFAGAERRFFNFAIRWFELANLKVLIRGKFSAVENSLIRQQLLDLGSFADLPVKQLIETEDPYEMLRLLETTAYADIVRHARRVYEEYGNDLFLLDATIDRSFFIDLIRRTEFLQAQDAQALTQLLGDLLDRFNLLWLLRYRFSYGLSPAKSFYLLTTIGNRLSSTDLMRLAKLEDIEQLLGALPNPYRKLLSRLTTIAEIEAVMEHYTLSAAADFLQSNNNLLSRCFAYILLREAEDRLIQALIKGKQLGLAPDLIKETIAGAG